MMAPHPVENSCPVPSLDLEPELRLLIDLEPRGDVFFENVGYLFHKPRTVRTSSPPAKFWSDVFVPTGLPWGRMAESVVLHVLIAVAIFTVSDALTMLIPRPPQLRLRDQ